MKRSLKFRHILLRITITKVSDALKSMQVEANRTVYNLNKFKRSAHAAKVRARRGAR